MRLATWAGACVILGGLAVIACSDEATDNASPDGADSGSTETADADAGPDGDGGVPTSGCNVDPENETFGLTDATKFADVTLDGRGLPVNARANSGRLIVDSCGFRILHELDKNYSIYTAPPKAAFTATSTTTIDGISEVRQFVKVGEDFAVVARTQDNKSYLYRMAGSGGPLSKVVSEPLLNDDFGMESLAVTPTRLFFNTYHGGPSFALRSAPVTAFATGKLPLGEPINIDSGDNARYGVFAWSNLVSFGFKSFAQDCVPAPSAGCTADSITNVPNLRFVFGTKGDAIYGWLQGTLSFREKSGSTTLETKPAGLTSGIDDDLISASIAPDGARVAVVGRASGAYRLHLITDVKTAPKGKSIDLPPGADGYIDVWTNGKVAVIVYERKDEANKPLGVQGIAWP